MGRGLFSLGWILLVLTVGLWIAGVAGWLPETVDDRWSALTLKATLVVFGAGVILRVLSPVTKQVARGRCAVCGRGIDRGQVYCHDHMQETVNSYRDQTHDRKMTHHR